MMLLLLRFDAVTVKLLAPDVTFKHAFPKSLMVVAVKVGVAAAKVVPLPVALKFVSTLLPLRALTSKL